jgi:hypothetical protein
MHGPSGSISVRKAPFLGLLCQLCRSNALGTSNGSLLCCFFFIACFAKGRFAYLHRLNISSVSQTRHTQAIKHRSVSQYTIMTFRAKRTKRDTEPFCVQMNEAYLYSASDKGILIRGRSFFNAISKRFWSYLQRRTGKLKYMQHLDRQNKGVQAMEPDTV